MAQQTDLEKKIAAWQKNPKRTYEAGVSLLKQAVKKWQANPYFDKKEDWTKLIYELSKVVPVAQAAPAGTVPPVDNAETTEPKEVKAPGEKAEEKSSAVETKNAVPEAPLNIVGKIDRDKLTPEQQAMFESYLTNYDTAIAMHEKLKAAQSDEERKDILAELVKQDELCGKLWDQLEQSIKTPAGDTSRADEKTQGEDKAKAMERLAELNKLIPVKQEALKNSKAKGGALVNQQNSLTKLITEQAEIKAKYGEE